MMKRRIKAFICFLLGHKDRYFHDRNEDAQGWGESHERRGVECVRCKRYILH